MKDNNETEIKLKQYLPMIEKAVWYHYHKFHLDKADLESQGFLIFCEAVKKYDKNLGSFSTYLTHELKRLNFYSKTEFKHKYKDVTRIKMYNKRGYGINVYVNKINIDESTPCESDYKCFEKVLDKIDYEVSLSQDAKEIVNYIISKEWEDVEKNWKPRFSHIQKLYSEKGWARTRIINAWKEIKEWWVASNKDQFCLG